MPIVEVHSPADMIVSLEGPQPVRLYPNIPAEINVYLFDTVAFKGFDGKSCYEYAVEGGYKGTEAEFTACMNKWLNEVCQADPIFAPHSAYFGFNAAETISDATISTLTHDPANTLAAREWPVINSQSPTPLYAHIVVPATAASYINTVGIKGGLAGIWGQAPVIIGGQPYIDIRSPYKFADASLTLVTTSKSGSISAMTWVTTNGQTILAHIANNAIHLSSQDRTKLNNLSGVNTGDQDLSGLEPKKGLDDFYISNAERDYCLTKQIQYFITTQAVNGFSITTDTLGNPLKLDTGTYMLNYYATAGGQGSGAGSLITFNGLNTGGNFRQNADAGVKYAGVITARQDRQYFMFQLTFTILPNGRIIAVYDGTSVSSDTDTVPSDAKFKSMSLINYTLPITRIDMISTSGLTINTGLIVQLIRLR